MKHWVSRDKGSPYGENRVYIWKITNAPSKVIDDETITYQDPEAIKSGKVAEMLVEEFEIVFGVVPKKGSCIRYSIPKIFKV